MSDNEPTRTLDDAARPLSGGPSLEVTADTTLNSLPGTHPPEGAGAALPGRIGRFEVRAHLGSGAFGDVYLAHDPQLDRAVALKVARPGTLATPSRLARFLREARAAANLRHPHIVPLFETGQAGDRHFIATAYIPGGTLAAEMTAGAVPFARAVAIVRKLAEALAYAHEQGVVHRDIKPANILLDDRRDPLLADFGLAKRDDELDSDDRATRDGDILGTPTYMSPEQAAGRSSEAGPASDQYALGVLLYEMLTGRPPFRGNLHAILKAHVEQAPESPRSLNRAVPRDLETIVLKCLEKDAKKRYASCAELAEDLRRWQAGEPITARRIGLAERAVRWAKRNPLGAAFVALVLSATVVTSILSWQLALRIREADAARQAEGEAKNAALTEARNASAAKTLAQNEAKNASEAKTRAEGETKRAAAALEVATVQRGLALNTVRTVLIQVDNELKKEARLAPLREAIVKAMLTDVDKIRDHALKNPLEDRTEAVAYSRLGEIYLAASRMEDAATWYRKAHAILTRLAAAEPGVPARLRDVAFVSHKLSEAEFRLGNGDRARELHAEALRLHEQRRKLLPENDEMERAFADQEIAEAYFHLGYDDLRLGEPEKAIENYRAADARFAALPPPLKNTLNTRRTRCEIQVRVADARSRLRQLDEAEAGYRQALADREEILRLVPQRGPNLLHMKVDVVQSRMYLGDFYCMMREDNAKARTEYAAILETLTALLKEAPDSLDLKQRLAATHYRLGFVAETPEKARAAFTASKELREELAKIDTNDLTTQLEFAAAEARLGLEEDADLRVARALRRASKDRQVLYQAACVLAVLADTTRDGDAMARYRHRSFEVLYDLIRLGWRDPHTLYTDPDMLRLRKDPRFAGVLKLQAPPRAEVLDVAPDPVEPDKTSATIRLLIPLQPTRTEIKVEGSDLGPSANGVREGIRLVVTPPLAAGKDYTYKIEATIRPTNHEKIVRTRDVVFRSGQTVEVDLRTSDDRFPDRVQVRWVPTPGDVAEEMCKLARVGGDDVVLDPGAGDAVVLLRAVQGFKAKAARGIDIDPKILARARANVAAAKLEGRIKLREGDALAMTADDLRDATVVMLYMGNELNTRLRPILWKHLRPGARIVSHHFPLGDWAPDQTVVVKGLDGDDYTLHVWTVTGMEKDGNYPRR